MVTTRGQEAAATHGNDAQNLKSNSKRGGAAMGVKRNGKKTAVRGTKEQEAQVQVQAVAKRDVEETKVQDEGGKEQAEPPTKKAKLEEKASENSAAAKGDHPAQHTYQSGTIERGHIYFFYRPRVELEQVHSIDDVQRFHILLVPRPPEFSIGSASANKDKAEDEEMNVVSAGADAVPAPPTTGKSKPFRLITVGKKSLPDPDAGGGARGGGRKAIFWATVATVGENLVKLQEGLGAKEYETKTKGTRHQGPARIAARGAYAIVNNESSTPSKRETHLGYHLSHPTPENFGEVQEALGIHPASSFIMQVKNPNAPATGPTQASAPSGRGAKLSETIMTEVFGAGGGRGRESYGLRFASVERREMLDYEGAELLFIAARSGDEGLEASLGEGRGEALTNAEKDEETHPVESVLEELAMSAEQIPDQPLEGDWR